MLIFILLIVTIVPIFYFSFFDYATGDDLGYGAAARQALLRGDGIVGVVDAACNNVRSYWHSWQGTWASVFLFSVEPSIWGERVYIITAWIALLCIIGGTAYFADVLLNKLLGEKDGLIKRTLIVSVLLLGIQYIPSIRGGIYWYTSVSHYIIPYGLCLAMMGWSIRWLDTGLKRYFVGILLIMTYLGGAGYPELVLGAAWTGFLVAYGYIRAIVSKKEASKEARVENQNSEKHIRRINMLLIPFALEMIGFVISAIAPGNKNRGGDDFGFSIVRVGTTIASSVADAAVGIGSKLIDYPLTIVLLVALILTVLYQTQEEKRNSSNSLALWQIVLFIVVGFAICCVIRMPVIYADAGYSGGVPDTYHFVDLLVLFLDAFVITDYVGKRVVIKEVIYTIGILLMLIVLVLGIKPIIKKSTDYQLYEFASSGRLSDYRTQMKERLEILYSDELDVELPQMNNDQGPYMHMSVEEDPASWANRVTAEFYGKNSVVAVPRDNE